MKFWIVVLATIFLGQTANANCDDLTKRYRVEAPALEQIVLWPEKGYFGCTKSQTAMLQKNYNAIERAEFPKSIDDLVGTWLGDDVIPSLFGLLIYSQEVIVIEKGVEEGTILVEQYMYQGISDEVDSVSLPRWEANSGYSGLIHRATLKVDTDLNGELASWQVINEERSSMKLYERSNIDQQFRNYFSRFRDGLGISLATNDVLVTTPKISSNLTFGTQTATFTKVQDRSPDLAILLVTHFSLDIYEFFECFTHQISNESGKLIDQLAVITLPEAEKVVSDVVLAAAKTQRLRAKYRELSSELRESEVPNVVNKQRLSKLKEEVSASFNDTNQKYSVPNYVKIKEIMESHSNLGC